MAVFNSQLIKPLKFHNQLSTSSLLQPTEDPDATIRIPSSSQSLGQPWQGEGREGVWLFPLDLKNPGLWLGLL